MALVDVTFTLSTPHTSMGGAIACIDLYSWEPREMDAALARIVGSGVPVGSFGLRPLLDADRGVVARWSEITATLFPHAGSRILERLLTSLVEAGLRRADSLAGPRERYPEARDMIEACALDAIASAPSPLAIDVVLRQAALWRERPALSMHTDADARALDRLLGYPTVALVGEANIGKSALTNAMARRAVSVVHDEPGTTRDHVGVLIDLAGLVVRWVDTPGLRETDDPVEAESARAAREVLACADLVLACFDSGSTPPAVAPPGHLAVMTRADLARRSGRPCWAVSTSVKTGRGLDELGQAVRQHLVPDGALEAAKRWRFHPALP